MNRNRMFGCGLLAAGLLIASGPAAADTIYKHVDEQGNVTYSSSPPKGGGKVRKLDVPDKPSPAEVAAARRQLEEDKRQLEAYDAERRRQEAERAKLEQERAAQERMGSQPTPAAVAADDAPVYYPAWGYRPPVRPVTPWPRPDPTPLPVNPSPPLMAPPIRPAPEPK
jgi:Domain of unknown function (DUF4124)